MEKVGKTGTSYRIYRTMGNQPNYKPVASNIKGTSFIYTSKDITTTDYITFKIVAMGEKDGEESKGLVIHAIK